MFSYLLTLLLLMLATVSASAAQADTLRLRGLNSGSLNDTISIMEDPTAKLGIQDILTRNYKDEFVERKELKRNGFGFTRSAIWVKSKVVNDSDIEEWIVGSPRPDFATMDVYLVNERGEIVQQMMIGTDTNNRGWASRLPAGRLHLEIGHTYDLYMKIESPLQLSLTFFMLDETEYLTYAILETGFLFAYFGTVIALILYNLSLFFVLRYRDYAFYVIVGISMVFNVYLQAGFANSSPFRIPFLGSTEDAYRLLLFPSIASMLYTRSFLRLREIAPRLNRIMGWLITLGAVIQVYLWTYDNFAIREYVSLFDGTAVILVFVGSIVAIRAGDKTARVFLMAWGIFATSVAIWVIGNMGLLEKNNAVAFSPLIGNMCEMVLMSMALALRFKEIDKRTVEAEMKAREKDNLQHLLRMVCHDISNPLSIIKTVYFLASRSVNANPIADELKQWDRVKRASDSIESIISQVRKYESFRSGKLAFEMKPCSLKRIFEDVEFFFHSRAQEKNITLEFAVNGLLEGDDIVVMADGISLTHEIINNLVSNAIKFTNAGGSVKVEASIKDGKAQIVVRDNGIGIPSDDIARIFSTESRSRSGTAREAGTGFGMPLVKTFLEMFGGHILISSKEKSHDRNDHGTTITIKLNLAA